MQFTPLVDASQMSDAIVASSTDAILRSTIQKAIWTAIVASAYVTASISYGSATQQQILGVVDELQHLGYTVTLGSTTFTVAWPA